MTDPMFHEWEPVIGLEIHVELNTKTKLFSSAPNHFGDEPNTNITDVCTGQPGTLPVLNREAVKKAVQFGCAISGDVQPISRFDRKSYFYPDSPRNFQITQYEMPIITRGQVTADVEGVPKTFAIHRVHLEDDAGMLKHFQHFAGVDYNRAGVPLIEIVSEPCMFTPKEAVAYAMMVKATLEYLDVSDCNMEEGSLRMDANISVRKKGETGLRPKIEIKNMNSFNFLELALHSEIKRQIALYLSHPEKNPEDVIQQATFRWDADRKETILMRRKEQADDYRYVLEPDLPPLVLEPEYIESIRESLPELPYEREKRYINDLQLFPDSASILVQEKHLADFFEKGLKQCSNAKGLCNWLIVEFAGRLKESGKTIWSSGIQAEDVGTLVHLIDTGKITGKIAKSVADIMVSNPGKHPQKIIEENPDFQPIHDEAAIEKIIDQVLQEQAASVQDYRQGKERAFGFLVGQVMKATQGKASPPLVNRILKEKINRVD